MEKDERIVEERVTVDGRGKSSVSFSVARMKERARRELTGR